MAFSAAGVAARAKLRKEQQDWADAAQRLRDNKAREEALWQAEIDEHGYAPLLPYVPDHLFLHGSWLVFEVGYEAIFSCLTHLAGGSFWAKLRFKR